MGHSGALQVESQAEGAQSAQAADPAPAPEPAPAPTAASPAPSKRDGWTRLALFLTVIALALGGVVLGSRAMPQPGREPFDGQTLKRLRKRKPDFVLLGNSMVNSRFHEQTLNRLLSPRKIVVMGEPGSKSAAWYLMLKNQILAAHPPKRVLIFFYGPELTLPRVRATGGESWRVERVSRGEEPVVEDKLAPDWSEPIARLSWRLGQVVPVDRFRHTTNAPVAQWATKVSAWLQPEPDESARSAAINGLFELDQLRTASEGPARELDVNLRTIVEDPRPFSEQAEHSFLPDILKLAREAGVALTFLHIRIREVAAGEPLPGPYRAYLDQLEGYLRARGAGFIDMDPNEWERIDFYGEGSHIKKHARRRYSQLFVEHMGYLFE